MGTEQSGHIAAVGSELYCELLEQAVRRLRELPPKTSIEVDVDLPGEGYLPRSYVPDMRLKIDLYRRLARVSSRGELDDLAAELADRFGAPPPSVRHMLWLAEIRVAAHRWQINTIHLEDRYAVFGYTSGQRIRQLAAAGGGRLRIVDGQSAYLPLEAEIGRPQAVLEEIKSLLQRA